MNNLCNLYFNVSPAGWVGWVALQRAYGLQTAWFKELANCLAVCSAKTWLVLAKSK